MKFPPSFLNTLTGLGDGAAEAKALAGEITLGKSALPDLFQAEIHAQEAVNALLPSRLVAFAPEVGDAFTDLRKRQLIRAGVTGSVAKLETRLAGVSAKLHRALGEAEKELKRLAASQGMVSTVTIPGNGCAQNIPAFEKLTEFHGDFLEKIDVLIALCIQLGAQIPEVKP